MKTSHTTERYRRTFVCGPLLAILALAFSGLVHAQEYRLPFKGRWFVMQGGDTLNVNHHMSVPAQWYGVDFAKVGGPAMRSLVRTNGVNVADFYSWDEPVLSPVDGEVVSTVNDLPDNELGKKDPGNPAGNHVVVKVAANRFAFIAHLRKGSVTVKPGERVAAGHPIGKCGNSGNSDFPHVHMHVQDTPTLDKGTGQNVEFARISVELTGKKFDNVTWPLIRGLFVSNR